jgi:aspartyl-tRNA(Asn)/glutamyl-tRNA(Gln) amidotransferase subunit A
VREHSYRNPLATVAESIRTGEATSTEIVEAVLSRIETVGPHLNCYLTVLADEARQRARALDDLLRAGRYLGPLHGIPVSLKDNIATRGVRTTAGSQILRDWIPNRDSTVAKRLHDAGAVLIAKAHLYEFADGVYHPLYGPVRNPWDVRYACGGSSNGSAAALAAGLCLGSVGTDTGGSNRNPAAFCGVVGLKPTYGLVSRSGVIPYSDSLDHVGPMARTVKDLVPLLQVIAGHDRIDFTSSPRAVPDYATDLEHGIRGLRLAYADPEKCGPVASEVRAHLHAAYGVFEREGAALPDVELPDLDAAVGVVEIISSAEAAAYHRRYLRSRASEYHPELRSLLEEAKPVGSKDYVDAQRTRVLLARELSARMGDADAVIMPAVPVPAYVSEERTLAIGDREVAAFSARVRFNALTNLTGQPAIVLPCGFSSGGLPIGLQLVGRHFDEATLLRIARAYERATNWHVRQPSLPR